MSKPGERRTLVFEISCRGDVTMLGVNDALTRELVLAQPLPNSRGHGIERRRMHPLLTHLPFALFAPSG